MTVLPFLSQSVSFNLYEIMKGGNGERRAGLRRFSKGKMINFRDRFLGKE